MEEKKNNAVEKVENIAHGKTQPQDNPTLTESERAQLKIDVAKKQVIEDAVRERAKATMLRQKNKLKEEKRLMRLAKVQEKIEQQELLKEKTEEERISLKRLERQARLEQREFKKKEKLRLKRERMEKDNSLKKQTQQSQNHTQRSRGFRGWLTAVIVLSITTIALATALTLTYLVPQQTDIAMESIYSKSFYQAVEQVDNIDLNLSKALATNDKGALQTYLVDLAINSELAENDIQQLPLQDESKYYTTKLINQIGDYAKHLNQKLINGQEITGQDKSNLRSLYNSNKTVKESLQIMINKMSPDYSFRSMVDGGNGNIVIENFNQLQHLSVQYPELIYDGPFSDGVDRAEIKGLTGEVITKNQAKDIYTQIFAEYNLKDVQLVGETTADIETFNVQATCNGDNLYAQISKKGGKLVMFAYAGSCQKVNYQEDSAIEKATEFLSGLDITDMKAVWINLANNVYTINFAYQQKGVIVYSDLIKVRVCAQTNMVIGLEATTYYTNHTQREVGKATLSQESAQNKINQEIEVETCRLAIVPIGKKTEKLCYEFSGEFDGDTYYVYIDANTGRQVELFKVINSTEGTMLM